MGDLTVADLIADPTLDTRVVAGAAGLGRRVLWAQTSEVPEPWNWLGPDELLMTVGLNLPADPGRQRDFIRKAHEAGIVALTIGEDGIAPPLSDAMLQECDRLGFPLLSTGPDTPFVVIARTVAVATASHQSRSVLLLSRLYQIAGRQDLHGKRSGAWVAGLCGTDVAVVDTLTGCTVLGDHAVAQSPHRTHALSTIRPANLLIPSGAEVDALMLVHLTQILTVDANTLLQEALNAAGAGQAQLRLALEGLVHPHDIDGGRWMAEGGTYRVIATDRDAQERLAVALALRGVFPLSAGWKEATIAVVSGPDTDRAREVLAGLGLPAGVSTEQATFADLSGAVDEALSARADTQGAGGDWVVFSGTAVSLLARSASEAERIVATVLGPLGGGSASHAVLRASLFALLDHDLQWQATADDLGIHRQTLAYRLRQVEKLTGRNVRRVRDLSELWLARSAWTTLEEGPEAG